MGFPFGANREFQIKAGDLVREKWLMHGAAMFRAPHYVLEAHSSCHIAP
jgi:hypothetical protein